MPTTLSQDNFLTGSKTGIQSLRKMFALAKIKASCEENWVAAFAGTSGVENSFTLSQDEDSVFNQISSGKHQSWSARHRLVQRVLCCGRAAPMEVEAPFLRGTSTPDPARMEADCSGPVYRVSHVVDGEFVNLLRRNHSRSLPFCHPVVFARASSSIPR